MKEDGGLSARNAALYAALGSAHSAVDARGTPWRAQQISQRVGCFTPWDLPKLPWKLHAFSASHCAAGKVLLRSQCAVEDACLYQLPSTSPFPGQASTQLCPSSAGRAPRETDHGVKGGWRKGAVGIPSTTDWWSHWQKLERTFGRTVSSEENENKSSPSLDS